MRWAIPFRLVTRTFQRAAWNFVENLFLNSIALVTVTVAMAIFASFLSLAVNLGRVLTHFSEEVRVTAYLKTDLTPAGEQEALAAAHAIPGVATVRFVSRDEALAFLRGELSQWNNLLAGLGHNPLPASIEIGPAASATAGPALADLVGKLRQVAGVSDVDYGKRWVERLSVVVQVARMTAVCVGGAFLLALLLLISNTLKLTLFARRDEIGILRIVGATERFIYGPLFLEGTMEGALGSALALLLLAVSRVALRGLDLGAWIPLIVGGVELDLLAGPVVWGTMAAGVLLGVLASVLALSRYAARF